MIFQVAAKDAGTLAKEFAPFLKAADLQGLGRYEVVTTLATGARVAPPATAVTLAAPDVTGQSAAARQRSRSYYGTARADVETAIRPGIPSRPDPPGRVAGGRHERRRATSRSSRRASRRVDCPALLAQAEHRWRLENARECLGFTGGDVMTTSITAKQLLRLRSDLTDRDWQIITTLARVRLATSAQLESLCFPDVTRRRAQQRLAILVRRRVLARLPRVIGGVRAGSRGHVYALDVAGQRLADLDRGRRPRPPRPVGAPYVDHVLAVAEVYARVALAERSGAFKVLRFVGEPGAWRSFFGAGGGRATLKPDAYVVLAVDGFEDHWFLEIDLGTESAATLTRKISFYLGYWRSGTEQARHDVFPKVLWLVRDAARVEVLARVIARQPMEARSLFVVALHDAAVDRMLRGRVDEPTPPQRDPDRGRRGDPATAAWSRRRLCSDLTAVLRATRLRHGRAAWSGGDGRRLGGGPASGLPAGGASAEADRSLLAQPRGQLLPPPPLRGTCQGAAAWTRAATAGAGARRVDRAQQGDLGQDQPDAHLHPRPADADVGGRVPAGALSVVLLRP